MQANELDKEAIQRIQELGWIDESTANQVRLDIEMRRSRGEGRDPLSLVAEVAGLSEEQQQKLSAESGAEEEAMPPQHNGGDGSRPATSGKDDLEIDPELLDDDEEAEVKKEVAAAGPTRDRGETDSNFGETGFETTAAQSPSSHPDGDTRFLVESRSGQQRSLTDTTRSVSTTSGPTSHGGSTPHDAVELALSCPRCQASFTAEWRSPASEGGLAEEASNVQCPGCGLRFDPVAPAGAEDFGRSDRRNATGLVHSGSASEHRSTAQREVAEGATQADAEGGDGNNGHAVVAPSVRRRQRNREADDALIGQTVGRCILRRKLGQGGMGAVYLGTHDVLEVERAVKILPREIARDARNAERFLQEARLTARLEHPNVLQVYDVGQQGDDFFYIVMQYADAGSLARVLRRRGRLKVGYALRLLEQIAQGLLAAHDQGIVHRDVKPDNVMLQSDGTAKIGDFGLAQAAGVVGDATNSHGLVLGSPAFMSPEQCDGADVDHRSDIYSLGVSAYQMLCGRRPFQAATPLAMMLMHKSETPPKPREVQADIPSEVERLVLHMLEKKTEARPKHMAEVLDVIREARRRLDMMPQLAGPSDDLTREDVLFGLIALRAELLTPEELERYVRSCRVGHQRFGQPPSLAEIVEREAHVEAKRLLHVRTLLTQALERGAVQPATELDQALAWQLTGEAVPGLDVLDEIAVKTDPSDSVLMLPTVSELSEDANASDSQATEHDGDADEEAGTQELEAAASARDAVLERTPFTLEAEALAEAEQLLAEMEAAAKRILSGEKDPESALVAFENMYELYGHTQLGPRLREFRAWLLPQMAAAHERHGLTAVQRGNADKAMRHFDHALRHDPTRTSVYSNRGITQLRRGNLSASLRDMDEAIRRDDLAMYHYNRGQILRKMNRLPEADEAYTAAIERDPAHDKAYCNRGGIRFSHRDLDGALADFEKALKINPANQEALIGRGKVRLRQGRLEEAVAEFERLLEVQPGNAKGLAHLGECLLEQGEREDARRRFQAAWKKDSSLPEPFVGLAVLAAHDGDADKALALLTKALKKGYRRFSRIKQEPAFEILKGNPGYQKLLAGMRRS